VTDGDKGNITVSGSGATWTIDDGVVTAGMLAGTLDLSGKTLTLPSDVTRLGNSLNVLPAAPTEGDYFGLRHLRGTGTSWVPLTGTDPNDFVSYQLVLYNTRTGIVLPAWDDESPGVTTLRSADHAGLVDVRLPAVSGTLALTTDIPAAVTPAGTGSELQFRSSGSAFGAVTGSSVSGSAITLGDAEAMGVTSTPLMTLRNTTAAAAGAQQVSPSLVLEGRGWRTNATAQSQTVRFRQNVLPVQGAASPTATWRLQSEVNESGTWVDGLQVQTDGRILAQAGTGYPQYTAEGATGFGFRVASDRVDFWGSGSVVATFQAGGFNLSGSLLQWGTFAGMRGDQDGGALAFRMGTTAQELHIANTWTSFANKEIAVLGWQSTANVLTIGTAKGSGGGTARPMSLVTDGTNRLTIDAVGRIIPVLPTSAAGLPTGALWNDAGTVKVAP
jgi:hypothetical protein